MRRVALVSLSFGVLLLAACQGAGEGTPDTDLGLIRGPVDDPAPPAAVPFNETDPGEVPARPAAFEGAPPEIPHAIDAFLPISADDNSCIDCHEVEGEPTPIPASHYVDLRRSPEKRGETIAGARYRCTACHVAPTGAPLLVANDFGGK